MLSFYLSLPPAALDRGTVRAQGDSGWAHGVEGFYLPSSHHPKVMSLGNEPLGSDYILMAECPRIELVSS